MLRVVMLTLVVAALLARWSGRSGCRDAPYFYGGVLRYLLAQGPAGTP